MTDCAWCKRPVTTRVYCSEKCRDAIKEPEDLVDPKLSLWETLEAGRGTVLHTTSGPILPDPKQNIAEGGLHSARLKLKLLMSEIQLVLEASE